MATSVTVSNIISGIFEFSIGSTNVGTLDGAVTTKRNATLVNLACEQSVGKIGSFESEVDYVVHVECEEAPLDLIRIAWNQPAGSLSSNDSLSLEHTPGKELGNVVLTFIGPATGTSKKRTAVFDKAYSMGAAEISQSRGAPTKVVMEFLCHGTVDTSTPPKTTWGAWKDAAY